MNDEAWHKLNDSIVAKGYEFEGSVMLPSDSADDGVNCPECGHGGFWVVLYHQIGKPENGRSANLCYDCGNMWEDGDESPDAFTTNLEV